MTSFEVSGRRKCRQCGSKERKVVHVGSTWLCRPCLHMADGELHRVILGEVKQ